jgi:hypothetical protein
MRMCGPFHWGAAPHACGTPDAMRIAGAKLMIERTKVKERMEVVCAMDPSGVIGVVDHLEGDNIKLAKDPNGKHHFIPLEWIASADDKLHLDRSGADAIRDWSIVAY